MRAAALLTLVLCLYVKVFGGTPTRVGDLEALSFPGGMMTFGLAKSPVHIAIARPYRLRRPGEQRVALGDVLDPWGTAIEMTENLAPDKPGTH